MATVIVFATNDGGIESSGTVAYSTIQAGVNLVSFSSELEAGDNGATPGQHTLSESFVDFDTSALVAGPLTAVVRMTLDSIVDGGIGTIYRLRSHDYGSSLTTADWMRGSVVATKTLVAHVSAATLVATGGGNSFDFVDDAAAANVVVGGNTRLVLASSRFESEIAVSGNDLALFSSSATSGGTASDPSLTMTLRDPVAALYDTFPKTALRR